MCGKNACCSFLTSSLKFRDVQFTLILKQRKAANLHKRGAATREYLFFWLEKLLNLQFQKVADDFL